MFQNEWYDFIDMLPKNTGTGFTNDWKFLYLCGGKRLLSSAVEQLIRNEQVAGSNPAGGSEGLTGCLEFASNNFFIYT